VAFLGNKRLSPKGRYAATAVGHLGLTATLFGMARLESTGAEPDEVESMPRNNSIGKPI